VCPKGRKKKRVKRAETSKVNWLNRFRNLPSGNRKKNKTPNSLQMLPLFSLKKKYIYFAGYIGGQKSTSSGVLIYASPSVTLIVIF
jgi:hypothetical protein